MVQEVDWVIDKLLESEDGIAVIDSTFNTAIINVLWQIVASKRFEPNNPETDRMMMILNTTFKTGVRKVQFVPSFIRKRLPLFKLERFILELKSVMKNMIKEHMDSIDYDHPRDFIDVYLTEMQSNPNFDEEHLVVICLDFFQAGAETTSTTLLWVRIVLVIFI